MLYRVLLVLVCFCVVPACEKADENVSGKLRVTTTTGMIADLVAHVGGDAVEVTHLMGPGVDPHLYKASEGDIHRLDKADVVFYNGLNLEGKMGDILVKMARRGKLTFAVTEAVDESLLREPPEFLGHFDPHIWFDVSLWAQTLPVVVEGLSAARPEMKESFEDNARQHEQALLSLHNYCKDRIATIPEDARVLVTAHDAFGYFGRAYGMEVIGLQGISTVSEYGLKDVERIVDLLASRKLKAVFVESSVPKRSIEAVAAGCKSRGHDVIIGGELFSDALGDETTSASTYDGMVRHNVETITKALQ